MVLILSKESFNSLIASLIVVAVVVNSVEPKSSVICLVISSISSLVYILSKLMVILSKGVNMPSIIKYLL